MVDNTVQIIVHATDAASGVLRGVTSQFGQLGGLVEQLTAQNINWGNVAQSATNLVIDGAKQVIKYIQNSVDLYDKYTTSIIDQARVLGLDTEETSRLVQASDDLFLSQEKLSTAMLAASRQGIDTSIAGLQSLSEKYLSLAPGVERAQFLLKTFGRSGADMGKLMELGADGIRKQMDAVEDSLVVNKQSVIVVTAYKKALDAASDAQDGLKYSIANGTMPASTKFNNQQATFIKQLEESNIITKAYDGLLHILTSDLIFYGAVLSGTPIKQTTSDVNDGTRAMQAWGDSLTAQAEAYKALHPEIELTSEEMKAITDANETYVKGVENWQSMITSYSENMASLTEKQAGLESDLATARAQGYWEQGEKIQGILSDMDDVNTAIEKEKKAYELKTKTVILGYMQEKLAADGNLDDKETAWLIAKGVEWGIYSQDAVKAYEDASLAADDFLKHRQASEYDNSITITTTYRSIYESLTSGGTSSSTAASIAKGVASGEGLKHNSNGGSWTIPSSYGNEGFMMGGVATASAGEGVIIYPENEKPVTKKDIQELIDASRIDPYVFAGIIKDAVTASAR